MEYAEISIAVLGTLAIAWVSDQARGRRGFGGATLVAGVGAVCGWFLSVRVFALAQMDGWLWVIWALCGAALSLFTFYLFRNTR